MDGGGLVFFSFFFLVIFFFVWTPLLTFFCQQIRCNIGWILNFQIEHALNFLSQGSTRL